jgi:hypothetical protein
MTRISFHLDQLRDRKTQKARSAGLIRGLDPFRVLGGELLTQSEFDDRLLASASKEGRKAAKEDRQEFE